MEVLDSVLLVDDDEVSAHLHEKLIKELGLTRHVISKSNGREAFDFIRGIYDSNRQLPSLILSDLSMPVMDGFKFVKEIRNSDMLGVRNIPISILSVSIRERDKKELEEFGVQSIVHKPLDEFKFFHILHYTIVPLLSMEHQKVILERQKFLEEQKSYLIKENSVIKQSLETIKRHRQEIEEKFKKFKK